MRLILTPILKASNMKRSLKYRLHEWAADRFSFVQYPAIRPVSSSAKLQPPIRFAHPMPFWRRVDVILFSLAGLAIAGIALFFLGFAAWSMIAG
jgi:hypothetical protein